MLALLFFFAVALLGTDVSARSAQSPGFAVPQPAAAMAGVRVALDRAAGAAANGTIEELSAALEEARKAIQQLAEPAERARAEEAERIYEDALRIRKYQADSPIGSFFDDLSSNGIFSEFVKRYPQYEAFIKPWAVRSDEGRVLYPTTETLRFLLNLQVPPPATPSTAAPEAASVSPAPPMTTAAARPAAPVSVGTCAAPTPIRSFELGPAGLVIHATSPTSARVTKTEQVEEAGFAGFTIVTVEVPFTEMGTAQSRLTSETGPFVTMRAIRYESHGDCGLRLRLEARESGPWAVQSAGNDVTIAPRRVLAGASLVPGTVSGGAQDLRPGGSLHVGGTYYTSSEASGGQIQIGVATNVGESAEIRGFFASLYPRQSSYFGAVAVSAANVAGRPAEIGIGDIGVSLAGPGATAVNQLTIRGIAANVGVSERSSLQVFGGRAALSSLRRLFVDEQTSDISGDKVVGVVQQWLSSRNGPSLSLAWARSLPRHGSGADDFLQSFNWTMERTAGLRATAEESVAHGSNEENRFGYAWTLEPRAATRKLSLDGYYRYTSRDFNPPLASSFFAGLRRSYSLAGSYQPFDRLSVSASLGQAKAFSILDPETSGTVTSSASSSASYRIARGIGGFVSYSESTLKSDPGVLVQADSSTETLTGGLSVTAAHAAYGIGLSWNHTADRADPRLDFESRRVDVNATYTPRGDLQIIGRAHYGSAVRNSGGSAGGDYGGSVTVESQLLGGSLQGEAGFTATPSGVAFEPIRQYFATLGYTPGTAFSLVQGSAQLTYQSVRVNGRPAENILWFSINAGRLFQWGGAARPMAPFETRALQLGPLPTQPVAGRIELMVFADLNRNGMEDPGEQPLAGVALRVRHLRVTTDGSGVASLDVPPGTYAISLEPTIVAQSYVALGPIAPVVIRQRQRKSVTIAVVPAGRLTGRIVFAGEQVDPSLLAGIRVMAQTGGFTRELVTTSSGELPFGLLPEGDYAVSVDLATLAPETRIVGPSVVNLKIDHGQRSIVTFTIRRATVREMFGMSR